MATIMLASVFAAMVPTGSASTGDKNQINVGESNSVIIGQKLEFLSTDIGSNIIGKVPDTVEGVVIGTATDSFASTLFPTPGTYFVDSNATSPGEYDPGETTLSVANLSFTVALKIDGDTVTATTAGQVLNVSVTTNIPDAAQGDIKVTKVEGDKLLTVDGEGSPLENLNMSDIDGFTLNTTGFDKGEYKIYIKTDKDQADGLAESSNTVTLTIYKEEITLTADKEEPVKGKDVKFTVQGPPDTGIVISTDKPDVAEMQTGAEKVPAGNASWADNGECEFRLDDVSPAFRTNENGAFTFIMQFNDDKKVNVKVRDNNTPRLYIDNDIDIDVQGSEVVLVDVPATAVVGDDIELEGTANTGDEVDIFIEGILAAANVEIEDGVFDEDIATGPDAAGSINKLKITGSVKIEIVVDDYVGANVGVDELDDEDVDADDSAVVRLVSGELTAKQADDVLTIEDEDYGISGTAEGVDDVFVLIFGPRGGSQILTAGDTFESVDVDDDDRFVEEDVAVIDSDVDKGKYTTVIVSAGRDGVFGINTPATVDDLSILIDDLTGKDADQILTGERPILVSSLWGEVGSDDQYVILQFQVESASITLDPLATVPVGDPINVTGTTNRADGTSILIAIEGPSDLTGAVVDVEDGIFSASIDTEGAKEGPYTIEADDGDGNTDTATVEILTAEATPTPTPTGEVTPTPTPTPTGEIPTATPTEAPTETPTEAPTPPGFEAVFAIAGLLAVAYLVLRKRRE